MCKNDLHYRYIDIYLILKKRYRLILNKLFYNYINIL